MSSRNSPVTTDSSISVDSIREHCLAVHLAHNWLYWNDVDHPGTPLDDIACNHHYTKNQINGKNGSSIKTMNLDYRLRVYILDPSHRFAISDNVVAHNL